jgi:hypothetical protein
MPPQFKTLGVVDVEDGDRRPSGAGQADQNRTLPAKMPFPPLPPRVEERGKPPGCTVNPGEIRGLAQIASVATPTSVLRLVGPAVLPRDNVFDVKTR